MTRTAIRHTLSALAAVALVFAFSSPSLSCDCNNCSAEHCPAAGQHPDFLWLPLINSSSGDSARKPPGSKFGGRGASRGPRTGDILIHRWQGSGIGHTTLPTAKNRKRTSPLPGGGIFNDSSSSFRGRYFNSPSPLGRGITAPRVR